MTSKIVAYGRAVAPLAAFMAGVCFLAAVALISAISGGALAQAADPLPSWNEGDAKQAILNFVAAVTRENSPDFVPPAQRTATFDNDGTLWVEQPMYVQLTFAIDRVKALAPLHPDWKDKEPFKAVLEGDMKALAAAGEKGLVQLIMETHAGMTHRRIRADREELACDCSPSPDSTGLTPNSCTSR